MTRTPFSQASRTSLALAAALLIPAGAALAAGGEAAPPEAQLIDSMSQGQREGQSSTLTHAEVRAALMQARADGTLGEGGEIGDSDKVLAARERSNAEMTERIHAEYAAAAAKHAAQAAADNTAGAQSRTELVMVLPDGTQETAFVEWYALNAQGEPLPISSHGADFAIVTLPQHTDAAIIENLRNASELQGLPDTRIFVEGGSEDGAG